MGDMDERYGTNTSSAILGRSKSLSISVMCQIFISLSCKRMHVSPASVVKFVGVVMVFPCLCNTPVTSCFWHTKSFLRQAIPFRQDLIQKTKE